jgi:hypothetical protein
MICNQNLNTDIKLSKYYNERNILKNIIEPITESTTYDYIFKDNNFLNEFNYKKITDQSYYTLYDLNLKQMYALFLYKKYNGGFFTYVFSLLLTSDCEKNFKIARSFLD